MDDLNLSDALQAAPLDLVEPEIRRDFMATLEAEKFEDVVGESVGRQEYIPLLDDDEKAAPKGSVPVAHSDSQLQAVDAESPRLAGAAVLQNGEQVMEPADTPEMWSSDLSPVSPLGPEDGFPELSPDVLPTVFASHSALRPGAPRDHLEEEGEVVEITQTVESEMVSVLVEKKKKRRNRHRRNGPPPPPPPPDETTGEQLSPGGVLDCAGGSEGVQGALAHPPPQPGVVQDTQPAAMQPPAMQPTETPLMVKQQPATLQPATLLPATPQPTTPQPATPQPATVQPETPQQMAVQIAAMQPMETQLPEKQPAAMELATAQPETEQLAAMQPKETQSTEKQTATMQPVETQSPEMQPTATLSATVQSVEMQLSTETQPAETKPIGMQPATTEVTETQPAAVQPAILQPEAVKPATLHPEAVPQTTPKTEHPADSCSQIGAEAVAEGRLELGAGDSLSGDQSAQWSSVGQEEASGRGRGLAQVETEVNKCQGLCEEGTSPVQPSAPPPKTLLLETPQQEIPPPKTPPQETPPSLPPAAEDHVQGGGLSPTSGAAPSRQLEPSTDVKPGPQEIPGPHTGTSSPHIDTPRPHTQISSSYRDTQEPGTQSAKPIDLPANTELNTEKQQMISPERKSKVLPSASARPRVQPPASPKPPVATGHGKQPGSALASSTKRPSVATARSSTSTNKDTRPKVAEMKSPVKTGASRPLTVPLSKLAASPTSPPPRTAAPQKASNNSPPKRPTSIKTEPRSADTKKPQSAKSPSAEPSRPRTASSTPVKSSPGTPTARNPTARAPAHRAPRPSTIKMTAAAEAKRVAPVTRLPPKPVLAPRPPRPASAPTLNLKNVRSKIGSTENMKYQPGGGKARALDRKPEPSRLTGKPEVSAVTRVTKSATGREPARPSEGKVQIINKKVDYSHVQSKCGSKDNIKHVPGGGNIQIPSKKMNPSNASAKSGSRTNLKLKSGAGDEKVEANKLDMKNGDQNKVRSEDNMVKTPGGGTQAVGDELTASLAEAPPGGAAGSSTQNGVGEADTQPLSQPLPLPTY